MNAVEALEKAAQDWADLVAQCDAEAMGRCDVPSGWCTYPDQACETGYKYEANAGDGLGGECVGTDPTGTGTGPSTSDATQPPLDTGPTGPTDTTVSTGPDPTETSSDDEPTTGPTCGGAGEDCCTGDMCDAGLACSEGLCGCVQSVTVGDRHTCIVKLDGSVWCWGANDLGQLATDPLVTPSSPVPLQIAGVGPAPAIEQLAARRHTCALRGDESVICWGDNASQKVTVTDPAATILVPTDTPWAAPAMQLGVGGSHTCVGRGARQTPVCWGDNASGQLGGPEAAPGPAFVTGGFEPFVVTLGSTHTCTSTLTGELYCWGANGNGQLAVDPALTPTSGTPILLGLPPVGTVAAGAEHTCATTGTDVTCWGRNDLGQLGIGTWSQGSNTPVLVTPNWP